MKYNKMNRRMFLQGAGQLLPMPFLVSLLPRELWAQANGNPIKRYIGVSSNYDYGRHQNWFPTMNRPAQSLVSSVGDKTLYYAPLSSYLSSSTAQLSRVFGNVLNSNIGSVNIIRGLDLSTRIAHGQGHVFGNFRANDNHESNSSQCVAIRTIDQVLRDNTRFNSINRDVAVLGNDSRSFRRNSSGNIVNAPSVSNFNTRSAYNYLFNNGNLPESNGQPGTSTAHPRAASLNGVMEDYTRVRNSSQISAADRVSLDNALDLLADIHRDLQGTSTPATGSCQHRSISTSGSSHYDLNEPAMRTYANMIVAAIMCDVSRVFMWNGWIDESTYDRHPNEDFHQGHSHQPFSTVAGQINWEYMGDVQHTFARSFLAPLINGLASANDPSNGRSYLYNSLVHFTVECSQVHGPNYQPCLLAGNAGGSLTSGYLLDYTDRSIINPWSADGFNESSNDTRFSHEYVGVPMNRVFNTILQAMGLTPAEYEDSSINTHFQNVSNSRYGAVNNGVASLGGYGHWGPSTSSYGNIYTQRMAHYNLHHFRRVLPMPSSSAS